MDHILYWNSVALEANRRDFSNAPGGNRPMPEQGGPTLSSRALAIVHLAMYDAHAGVVGGANLPPYLPGLPAPAAGASAAVAVAHAARDCLAKLYPRQTAYFDQALAGVGLSGPAAVTGAAFGRAVALAHLANRSADPGAGDAGYVSPGGRRAHRADPSNPGQGLHAPFYGAKSNCFAVTARHGLQAPPITTDALYQAALEQLRGKGIAPELMGTVPSKYAKREVEESLIGVYWAYDGVRELGTPPRLYNLIVRDVAMQKGNGVDANARLFALLNAALGDAGILAWDQKYLHNLWRPVLGVREHDASMGPASTAAPAFDDDCDPSWLPLGAPASNSTDANFTPPFPAYPSGHATFGAAAFHIVRLFYGVAAGNRAADNLFTSEFVSEECNGVTRDNKGVVRARHARRFPGGLWQMIEENGFSRVYLGVHWSFDAFALDVNGQPDFSQNIGGAPLGLKIAEDIFAVRGGGKVPGKSAVGPRP